MDWQGRQHFLGVAGKVMRQIIVDEARRARSLKRNRAMQTHLTGDFSDDDFAVEDVLVLEELLRELSDVDPAFTTLVEARVFAGMTNEETAAVLGISLATVKRRWQVAKAWLSQRMQPLDG